MIHHSGNEMPIFSIEKTACFGSCPVYKAEIYNSGRLVFNGIRNTKLSGKYCSTIDKRQLENLTKAFQHNNYMNFNDAYTSRAKDLPTTVTYFNFEGRQKKVVDYDKAPAELKILERMLENIVDSASWKSCK